MVISSLVISFPHRGEGGGVYKNLEIRYFNRKRYAEWHDFEYRFISKKKPSSTFELPKQELYVRVEAPKGKLGIFLKKDHSGFPCSWKIRPPGFTNLQMPPQLVIHIVFTPKIKFWMFWTYFLFISFEINLNMIILTDIFKHTQK